MTRTARTARTAPAPLTALEPGTQLFTIGTFHRAEVVTSEINERGHQVNVLRWTEDNLLAGIWAGDTFTWVRLPGRTPRFIVSTRR